MSTPPVSVAALLDAVHDAGGELGWTRDGLNWLVRPPDPVVVTELEAQLNARFLEVRRQLEPWRCHACRRPAELPLFCTSCYGPVMAYLASGGRFVEGPACAHAVDRAPRMVCGWRYPVGSQGVIPGFDGLPDWTPCCKRCLARLVRRYRASPS